jgi:FKBP-type peptidyl-prolyl cis-trans isomerase (trigger factor)
VSITREEIEKRMDQLAHKYVETPDPELTKELYQLAVELEEMKKLEKQ